MQQKIKPKLSVEFIKPEWTIMMVLRNILAYFLAPLIALNIAVHLIVFISMIFSAEAKKKLIRSLLKFNTNLFFKVFNLELKIKGHLNVSTHQNYIFVAPHRSWVDVFCMMKAVAEVHPESLSFMIKAGLLKIPIWGQLFIAAGYIPVEQNSIRSRTESNLEKLSISEQKCSDGANLCIFPEGTRSQSHKILPFKKGAVRISEAAQTPILPVIIKGAGELFPKGSMFVRHGPLSLEFLEAVYPEHYSNVNEMNSHLYNIIVEKYNLKL